MSNEAKKEIVVQYDVDGNTIKLSPSIVQDYIVGSDNGKITIQEFKFFTELCKARKLNPFLNEAYCIKYGNKPAQIVVGKDAVLKRAILNPNFNGIQSGIIVRNNETGVIEERQGTFYIKRDEELVGGWAKVYRKNWEYPTYSSVSFDEVAQRKSDGSLNTNWTNKGATMIEKVAKVRALRETFIEDLGGMYEAEEMGVDIHNDNKSTNDIVIEQQEHLEVEQLQEETVTMNEI